MHIKNCCTKVIIELPKNSTNKDNNQDKIKEEDRVMAAAK